MHSSAYIFHQACRGDKVCETVMLEAPSGEHTCRTQTTDDNSRGPSTTGDPTDITDPTVSRRPLPAATLEADSAEPTEPGTNHFPALPVGSPEGEQSTCSQNASEQNTAQSNVTYKNDINADYLVMWASPPGW